MSLNNHCRLDQHHGVQGLRLNARGANFLDPSTSAQIKELNGSSAALKREKIPLTADARNTLVRSQGNLRQLNASIDGLMDKEEQRQDLARRLSKLSPGARALFERSPEYRATEDITMAISAFSALCAAEVASEFCTE
jgi:hypothetical protein